ncbi:MAG: NAD-dependent epimerase/dehydratase family protein [Microbacterium sp.]
MTNVLILGGTGWLSGRIATRWLDAGATVTCLARGGREAPYGARLVVADRADAAAYDGVKGTAWDEIVDVSSQPAQVADAVAALAGSTRHWTYVSSFSVYADDDTPHADESAALAEPLGAAEEYDYSRAKAACEASVRAALTHRAAILRPGLIVGPDDPTDRFGYWVGRFALAGTEPVLVPEAPGAMAQVIDVDDLADFAVAVGRERWTGAVNTIGDPLALADLLSLARAVAGHRGPVVTVADDWLDQRGVAHWSGPRSLPLWLPGGMTGFSTRTNTVYRLLGGAVRPLRATLERALVDERSRGLDRARGAGLDRDDERALIAASGHSI